MLTKEAGNQKEVASELPSKCNALAEILATSRDAKVRDAKLAYVYAEIANRRTEYKNPRLLTTLAAVYANRGDFQKAIEWQGKAIELETRQQKLSDMKDRLKLYQNKKPYRHNSFRDIARLKAEAGRN